MKQILLNSAKNSIDVNVESAEFISLSTKQRNIPSEHMEGSINNYELYLKERNECKNYKLLFTIHPYMSNALFNAFTEVVYNEGGISSGIITPKGSLPSTHQSFFQRSKIKNEKTKQALFSSNDENIDRRYQLIRDTECDHPDIGVLNYHCGLDIFNNHYLRSNGFFTIKSNKDNKDVFNTIEDLLIYSNGKTSKIIRETPGTTKVKEKVIEKGGIVFKLLNDIIKWFTEDNDIKQEDLNKKEERNQHLFNRENLSDIYTAFSERIKDENGWVGFYNRPYLPELNSSSPVINKCINGRNSCDFIDMYPDRTLFSMMPKINDLYGGREEYNWKWMLTYPYESTTKDSDGYEFDFFNEDGIKIMWVDTSELFVGDTNVLNSLNTYNVLHETPYVYFRTKCKHNLVAGDTVRFKHSNGDFTAQVMGVGDVNQNRKEYYFFISYDDLADEFGELSITIKDSYNPQGIDVCYVSIPKNITISKLINGAPCKYYVRKFKKIRTLPSILNKVGFSKTIYGDAISQILFSENVNLSGLKDNLGREISEIYLTIVKNNKGWENFYLNGITSPLLVDFSHCFGRITSGFNFEYDANEFSAVKPHNDIDDVNNGEYFQKHNVRSLYNLENFKDINLQEFCNVMGIKYIPPKAVENNLSEKTEIFYGDFVEFSLSTVTETIIEDIYHRFNTAQREINFDDKKYFDFNHFKYDELEFDDYDFNFEGEIGDNTLGANAIDIPEYTISINNKGFRRSTIDSDSIDEDSKSLIRDNIFPEGYFYKPHHRVKLKEFSDIVSFDYDIPIVDRDNIVIRKTQFTGMYEFTANNVYSFTDEDKIVLYYRDGRHYEYFLHQGTQGDKIVFLDLARSYDEVVDGLECIFVKNKKIPEYAYYCSDGTGKYIWKELIKDTEITQTSDIYNRTYANGAVYINTNINFYLRRQDPNGDYGVMYTDGNSGDAYKFIINGVNMELPDIDYKTQENYSICEN